MEYAQVLENARKNIGPNCKACPVCNGLGCGKEGIECYLDKIKTELTDTMYMCGARKIADINEKMIRIGK